ncbi:Apoptosis regulatory protein Siva [Habropoda laboriosa]|uniref:Apoptosis regulatory protein Siva n=1 Tax=Habropoda laboriosa TaxID=597456 RepID=A0A0L7RDK0_9HYME|nr:Apoptosis regulatory protein Siva [Habropoda laboriosa]
MPKRPCPFEDDLPPQLKVHVGQKQVDNGVCREERMKIVYGKTMDLLKEGVKTLSRQLNTSMELNPIDAIPSSKVPSPCKFKTERNLKTQMVLNSKLELLGADKAIKVSRLLTTNVKLMTCFFSIFLEDVQPRYDLCECNRIIDQSMFSKCSYCDQVLCSSCLFECTSCSELFCQNCSLPVYNNEEQNKCLNCYK